MCDCINIDIGSYKNQIMVPMPWWMVFGDGKILYEFVCIDKCVYGEILDLWKIGITTTGCCCGHNVMPGYIGVHWRDVDRMVEMGYEFEANKDDAFYPRSIKFSPNGEKRLYNIETRSTV